MANCEVCGEKIGLMNQAYFVIPGTDSTANMCKKCDEQISKLKTPTRESKAEAEKYLQPFLKNSQMRKELFDYLNSLFSEADEMIAAADEEAARKEEEEAARRAAREGLAKNKRNFKMTTGYQFDGYRVTKYIKVVSGEVVLGTGFLSTLNATVSDVFGATSTAYESKLGSAKDLALRRAVENSLKVGANALIGIDFDIMTVGNNMMVVCANGTAVYIERI